MRIKYQVVTFDAADLDAESSFWAGELGGKADRDLWVEDFGAAHEQVIGLGARVLQPARGATEGDDFQVYADPAGHPFCLCFLVDGARYPDRFTVT